MGSNIKRIVILMIVLMFVAVAGIVLYANIRSEEKAVQTAQMDTETGAYDIGAKRLAHPDCG